ncbi:MAG: malto-oligosyltrehalose trehalohydrolase [Pirellulales bacterium]
MPYRPICEFAKSHGVEFLDGDLLRFRLWAPRQASVELMIHQDGAATAHPMLAIGSGYFEWTGRFDAAAVDNLRYAYRVPAAEFDVPDPASAWQPDGVHRLSALFDPRRFAWTDGTWRGLKLSELSLYELHVGTFTTEGTLDAAVARLPELAELGVTAVELMPLAQFPGTRGWGYDGVHFYAVQNSYGGPAALQRFVDAAHRAGLGVVLDVVYNHFGPEGNYAGMLAPYFTSCYHTPWGDALNYDGPDCEPVRRYVIDSACRWVRDFHIDGLRLDAVQTIFDCGSEHILAELAQAVHAAAADCGRNVVVTAETDQNDTRLIRSRSNGGYALDAVWSDDFHHAIHALLTGERHGYYEDFGEVRQLVKSLNEMHVYDGCYSPRKRRRHGSPAGDLPRERFIICIQNHDQIGNRAGGERLGVLVSPAAQRLAAALLLTSPGTPLLFMGQEYGEPNPFPYFCSFLDDRLVEAVRAGRGREFAEFLAAHQGELFDPQAESTFTLARPSWSWRQDAAHSGLRHLYRTLLHARRTFAPLVDRTQVHAAVVADHPSLLEIRRGAGRKP